MEDFKKTLNSIGQDAMKTAKKLKNIATLNIEKLTAEDKRKNYFAALGKLYYEKCAQQAEGEFEELCKLIEKNDETIENLKGELAKEKGMKKCTNCGKEIKAYSVFCPYCGNEAVDNQEDETNDCSRCPTCGEKAPAGAVCCCVCGTKFN